MNSRNHMKMQKFVIFVQKNLKINMLKINNIERLGIIVIIQVNIEEVLYICNLKYGVSKEIFSQWI